MIIVIGDIHGDFGYVNKFLNSHNEVTTVLQCGDFGYWPKQHNKSYLNECGKIKHWDQYSLYNKDVKFHWCDGNHEDFQSLKECNYKPDMKNDNIIYQSRGSYITLLNGKNVLFIGGACSVDKKYRTQNIDWFPEEIITQYDINNLPNVNIDIVISHTAPMEFQVFDDNKFLHDPSRDVLSVILNKYKPMKWYFGHFHTYKKGRAYGCEWVSLAYAGSGLRWWIELGK